MVASSGRRADFGRRGGPGRGAAVDGGRGGEFNRAGRVPSLELPKQLFVGPAQPLLLLGLFLNVFLEIGVFLRQLSAWGEDNIKRQSCQRAEPDIAGPRAEGDAAGAAGTSRATITHSLG